MTQSVHFGRTTKALFAVAGGLMVVVVAQAIYIGSRPQPVRVLDFPQQRVLSTELGINGPAVRLTPGALMTVQGTKCNLTGTPVPVTGEKSWVSLDPPGTVVASGHGSTVRRPGCVVARFTNPIPETVADRTRVLLAATPGLDCVTWQLTGREVPDDPGMLPATWTTEPFRLCPPPKE